jgi:anti-sigma regulatory factor (Ser/Thr protein kinase)
MVDTVLELAVPASFPEVGALRHAVDAFLRDSADEELRYRLLLVVSELCTNAVEALHDPGAELTLRVRDRADVVLIEVEDTGPGFGSATGRRGAEEGEERGRGLQVVASLVDELSVDRVRGRTIVRCRISK